MVPDLFESLDYRAWLRDWYEARKAANPRFSHRAFVRRTGQKSPSLLADVIERRRNLTPELVVTFGKALKLSAEEQRFFALLVELDQAKDADARNAAWELISASRRFREARRVEGASFEYVAEWWYPAIRELALREDFVDDPAWVARQLHPTISVAKARRALVTLKDLGMLVEDGDRWIQAEGAVVTPREVLGLAVDRYHRGMLDLAREGIRGVSAKERHYLGVTVCIPQSLVPKLKAELNAFTERLLELCDGAEEPAERVYQMQLSLFPLSEEP
ncbi:MAG: TIGR02147 family protein [Proteobacteria bacterium]|nr:TIGR02147 family protein [Pseudomonadota bacterium]MCP4915870.1 TIGR02147 family protein [Pseudomonadota bacterium]